jgi:hypothetical protein
MTKAEKRILIRDLCNSVRGEVMNKVTTGDIPEEWEAAEIRQYLAETFAKEICRLNGQRFRDYLNTLIIYNL